VGFAQLCRSALAMPAIKKKRQARLKRKANTADTALQNRF